jgi:hypothetical protein
MFVFAAVTAWIFGSYIATVAGGLAGFLANSIVFFVAILLLRQR